ncbi:MAG TPA: alpha/beta fold hydrolase [Burkholderiaceae bacterium]|nr:alpha/beta fold hydrolase [Burkholderiaceae bacterium]
MSDSSRPAGIETVFDLPDFKFENGQTLPLLRIAHVIYGRMNAARDNVILIMPGTSNTRLSVEASIGPGRAFDTDRYCVVSSDAIGGGGSTQPGDGLRGRFPEYGIRDMVRAQVALVRDGLGLGETPLAAVAGASMGAFQALEWVIHHPGTARAAILQVPATRAGQVIRQTTRRMREMIELDPQWRGGQYTEQPLDGLRLAGRHYHAWTVTDAYLEAQGEAVEAEAIAVGERFAQWDAWSLIRRYQASSRHDVAQPFGGDLMQALSRITARLLVLPCLQDRLLGIEEGRRIAAGVPGARCEEIDSLRGHMAWRPVPGAAETEFTTRHIRDFLR